ncbi:MAG: CehA/McbA family metallohydrolase [Planctomycetota bacterium]|nr:CehA/McbA family metallohydrolase [Planctomycetota bacterium]
MNCPNAPAVNSLHAFKRLLPVILGLPLALLAGELPAQSQKGRIVLIQEPVHLRSAARQEWSRFPQADPGPNKGLTFQAKKNDSSMSLVVRQNDVRQVWQVRLNGKNLGNLKRDQNDLTRVLEIPADSLLDGENRLTIETGEKKIPDDILVGPIVLVDRRPDEYLAGAEIEVRVRENSELVPARITLVDSSGSLVPLGIRSSETLAVREGVVYTSDGMARILLPAGTYDLFVHRGFEYSRGQKRVRVGAGEKKSLDFRINRVVDTRGWVSCDPHVHTVTHSGHGDCTIEERMVTLAGENLELPVATDHNKQIDYRPVSRAMKTSAWFTPLIGNEVTTRFGHFNAFPFLADSGLPDHRQNDWDKLLADIYGRPGVRIAMLNHARDVHAGYRPFAAANFNEASGESLNGRPFLFNAMEVINSAAQQTDPLELFRDWMAITNRGHRVLPMGSSDSHDVNAFIVGQGRTYIRCDDRNPGQIDTSRAIENLSRGQLLVSCGLLAKIRVNGKYGPGDLVPGSDLYEVECEMSGPGWIPGNRLELYRNGWKVREAEVPMEMAPSSGHSTRRVWKLKGGPDDCFLTLLVCGPGIRHPGWPLAQPYQPTSPQWEPRVFGLTGAVYLDGNKDGRFQSAHEIARQLVAKKTGQTLETLVAQLASRDPAVAVQAASLWQRDHGNLLAGDQAETWRAGGESVRRGFTRYLEAWRKSEAAGTVDR